MRAKFSPATEAAVDRYVYALVDPRRQRLSADRFFYVGKGTGQRCFAHARAELEQSAEPGGAPGLKNERIAKIRELTGAPPPIVIIAHEMSTDEEALRLESILIKLLGTDGNAVLGQRSAPFVLDVDEVEEIHGVPLRTSEFSEPVLLVNLSGGKNERPFPEIKADQGLVAQRTLGDWWGNGLRAAAPRIRHVLGIYRSVIRCVFTVEINADGGSRYATRKRRSSTGKRYLTRYRFQATRSPELEAQWVGKSVVDATGKMVSTFPRQAGCIVIGL